MKQQAIDNIINDIARF